MYVVDPFSVLQQVVDAAPLVVVHLLVIAWTGIVEIGLHYKK